MFSIDFDINFVMKKIRPSIRDCSSLRRGKIPYGGVALTQGEELKFLAGINHNTPFVFFPHGINIMYDINSLQGIALVCTEGTKTWTHCPINQSFRNAMHITTNHHRGSKSTSLTSSECVN